MKQNCKLRAQIAYGEATLIEWFHTFKNIEYDVEDLELEALLEKHSCQTQEDSASAEYPVL